MKLKNEIAFIFLACVFYTFSICKAYVMGEKNYQKQDHSEVTITNLQSANKDLLYTNHSLKKQVESLDETTKLVLWIKQQGIDLKIVFPNYK